MVLSVDPTGKIMVEDGDAEEEGAAAVVAAEAPAATDHADSASSASSSDDDDEEEEEQEEEASPPVSAASSSTAKKRAERAGTGFVSAQTMPPPETPDEELMINELLASEEACGECSTINSSAAKERAETGFVSALTVPPKETPDEELKLKDEELMLNEMLASEETPRKSSANNEDLEAAVGAFAVVYSTMAEPEPEPEPTEEYLVEAELVTPNSENDDDPVILVTAKEDHSAEHTARMRRHLVVALLLLVAAVSACVAVVVLNRGHQNDKGDTEDKNPSVFFNSQTNNKSATSAPTMPLPPMEGWVQRGEDIFGTNETLGAGESVALSNNGSVLAIGGSRSGLDNQGHICILDWNSSSQTWKQRGDLIVGQHKNAWVGSQNSIALSGDGDILASIAMSPGFVGPRTQIFEWTILDGEQGYWKEKGQAFDREKGGNPPCEIALSNDGNAFTLGSVDLNDRISQTSFPLAAPGRIQVYSWNETSQNWTQQGEVIKGQTDYDLLGLTSALSSNGSVLAVSAIRWGGTDEDPIGGPGQVRIYEWNESHWNQLGSDLIGKLPGGGYGKPLGLSLDGRMVAIGSSVYLGASLVEVFHRDPSGSNWAQMGQTIYANSTEKSNRIEGLSIASSLTSAENHRTRLGICFQKYTNMYDWNSSTGMWDLVGTLIGVKGEEGQNFGISLSRNGEVVAIGYGDEYSRKSGPSKIYEWHEPEK